MEIYLLREEKEVGPYAPEDLRLWLQEGHVTSGELAWAPGCESWVPLNTLLDSAPAEEPAPSATPAYTPPPKANAKQKAFLSYMGVSFNSDLTEEHANHLLQQVSKDRKLAARMARWEDDRLDLHPEMFAEEIQLRRANRPAYFHKLVLTEGGDCFTGVTKAHCQVLVQYLDVNHPRWDANLRDATWHFFFPAIAEKFPQLVHKEWRPKLKFKDGPKVADELLEARSSGGANAEGGARKWKLKTFLLLLVAAVIGAGVFGWKHPEKIPLIITEKLNLWGDQFNALVRGDAPAPVKKKVTAPQATAAPVSAKTETAPPVVEEKPAETKPAEVAMETKPEPAPSEPAAPAALPKPTEGLFNPNANATPPTPATPAAATGKTEVRILKPIPIQGKYGTVTINSGTVLKVLSHDSLTVTVSYLSQPVRVPMGSTDF